MDCRFTKTMKCSVYLLFATFLFATVVETRISPSSLAKIQKANEGIIESFMGKKEYEKYSGGKMPRPRPGKRKKIKNTWSLVKAIQKAVHTCAENLKQRKLPDDHAITIGDVIYQPEQLLGLGCMMSARRRHKRLTKPTAGKWPDGIVYYQFHDDFENDYKPLVRKGARLWAQNTCLTFKEGKPPREAKAKGRVLIKGDNVKGCQYSTLGYLPPGVFQQDSLMVMNIAVVNHTKSTENYPCGRDGMPRMQSIMHEWGHVINLEHQHKRPDRNAHISLMRPNETQNKLCDDCTTLGTPYDFGSVMHYKLSGSYEGDKIVTKNGSTEDYALGYLEGTAGSDLNWGTFYDYLFVNKLYCSDACGANSPKEGDVHHGKAYGECQNGGYPHPRDCSKCICPEGWGGKHCQKLEPGFPLAECSRKFTVTSTEWQETQSDRVNNPNGVRRKKQFCKKCTYVFRVEEKLWEAGWRLKMQLTGFDDAEGVGWEHWWPCDRSYIEIRYTDDLIVSGPRLCYTDTSDYFIQRNGKMIMLLFRSGDPDAMRYEELFQGVTIKYKLTQLY